MRYLPLLLWFSLYGSEIQIPISLGSSLKKSPGLPNLSDIRTNHEAMCRVALHISCKKLNGEEEYILPNLTKRLKKLEQKEKYKGYVKTLKDLVREINKTNISINESDTSEHEDELRPFFQKLVVPAMQKTITDSKQQEEWLLKEAANRWTKKETALITGIASVIVAIVSGGVALAVPLLTCD